MQLGHIVLINALLDRIHIKEYNVNYVIKVVVHVIHPISVYNANLI